MQLSRVELTNGMRIVHAEMPEARSVTLSVSVGLGSRYEPPKHAGVAHLIEHMLFKGTTKRPGPRHISETLDTVGGAVNASTDKETTTYWAKVARDDVALAMDLLADMLLNSRLRSRDLERERTIVLEELHGLSDDPQAWAHVLADELVWPGQSLGREIVGTPESVEHITRPDLIEYMRQYYGPNNAVLSCAGALPVDDVANLTESCFGAWAPVSHPAPAPAVHAPLQSHRRAEYRDSEQAHVCLIYPGVARAHPDSWPLEVLALILGGGTTSRLFLHLRERLAVVYDVYAASTCLSDTGAFTIYFATDPTNLGRAVDAVQDEISRLQARRVPLAALSQVKRSFRGRLWLGLEDTPAVAGWLGDYEMILGRLVTPEYVLQQVEEVTPDDIRRVARDYLGVEGGIALVGPVPAEGAGLRAVGA